MVNARGDEKVPYRDQIAKNANIVYAPGYCGWSGSLFGDIISNNLVVQFDSYSHLFVEPELLDGQHIVRIGINVTAEDVANLSRRIMEDEDNCARIRQNLRTKATDMMSLDSISEYVIRLITRYHTHTEM